jgi:hypothetical protein
MDILSIVGSLVVGFVAILSPLLSERVRAIWRAIFARPNRNSVLLEINGDTLELNDVSQEDVDRLVDAFMKRAAGREADGGEERVGDGSVDND